MTDTAPRFFTNLPRSAKWAALLAGLAFSLNVQAADLLQIYHQALANDSVYTSARANLSAGQEASVQGRAGLLPEIALSGITQRNSGNRNGNNGYADSMSNSYTLSLSQPLFDVAAWQNYEQSKLSVAASEAAFAVAQQDLILRVAQAYFDVLTAQDALTSLQAEKAAILEQLAFAKQKFAVGTATITDTHEAQARYDLAVSQELAAQNTLAIARSSLEQIIGAPPADLAALRAGVELRKPEPAGMAPWVTNAEQQNFTVVQQQLSLEIAKRAITRDRAGHYPTVDLVASRSDNDRRDTVQSTSSNGPNNAIGVQWTIPLFSGFAVTSRVRQAIALEDKARADLETARRTAAQNARQAFLGVNSGLAQVKALEAAEKSSRSALESNQLGYEVGVRINIDVLNAQQQLYSTRSELSKARYDTLMNSLRLKAAAGTLQERDVVEINTLLTQS